MLVKVVIIFLGVIVLIGMVGKFLFPDRFSRKGALPRIGVQKCKGCGRPKIGPGPCACGQESR